MAFEQNQQLKRLLDPVALQQMQCPSHVIENLQVIPGVENIKKKNKFEIDDANQIR